MAKRTRRLWRASKPTAQVIQAQGFEVLDDAGRVRARLGPSAGSEVSELGVGLVILGADGTSQLAMTIDASGSSIHFTAAGKVLLSLAVLEPEHERQERTCLLAFRSSGGQEVVGLTVSAPAGGPPSF